MCVMIRDLGWSRAFGRLLALWCHELRPLIAETRAFLAVWFPCLLYLGYLILCVVPSLKCWRKHAPPFCFHGQSAMCVFVYVSCL